MEPKLISDLSQVLDLLVTAPYADDIASTVPHFTIFVGPCFLATSLDRNSVSIALSSTSAD